ncbi:hypothetical protein V8F44DRAFT_634234 [Aspergillus fumigatus]
MFSATCLTQTARSMSRKPLLDCHTRLGGATGTELTPSKCRSSTAGIDSGCSAGSLMMHITSTGSAYLENVGLQTIRQCRNLAVRHSIRALCVLPVQQQQCQMSLCGMIQIESPYYQPTPSITVLTGDSQIHRHTKRNQLLPHGLIIVQLLQIAHIVQQHHTRIAPRREGILHLLKQRIIRYPSRKRLNADTMVLQPRPRSVLQPFQRQDPLHHHELIRLLSIILDYDALRRKIQQLIARHVAHGILPLQPGKYRRDRQGTPPRHRQREPAA